MNDDGIIYCKTNWSSNNQMNITGLLWQKEASDNSDISCKIKEQNVCHFHWHQWNIMMSYPTYLSVGVFMHKIWPGTVEVKHTRSGYTREKIRHLNDSSEK